MSKLLLYCTKAKPYLVERLSFNEKKFYQCRKKNDYYSLNGKIVAECDFEVEEIIANDVKIYDEYGIKYTTKNGCSYIDDNFESLLNNSCLNAFELNDYLSGKNGYAIHIKNLHIFDKPKELNDYYKFDGIYNDINNWKTIDKAPQNMMYAYDLISELGFSGTYNMHLKKKHLNINSITMDVLNFKSY